MLRESGRGTQNVFLDAGWKIEESTIYKKETQLGGFTERTKHLNILSQVSTDTF